MKKPAVDPIFTFGVSLVVSLIVWFPSLRLAMHGGIDITDAGSRYFLTLLLSWAGVHLFCAVIAMCASGPRCPPPPRAATEQPARRRDDAPANHDSEAGAA
jgi:hypothetical protein